MGVSLIFSLRPDGVDCWIKARDDCVALRTPDHLISQATGYLKYQSVDTWFRAGTCDGAETPSGEVYPVVSRASL